MISPLQTARLSTFCATLVAVAACGEGSGAIDSENALIDPPAQCSPDRPDCSVSEDFPDGSDLNATNSAGLRYSDEASSLVIDRESSLPDSDGDGVPDDADDCPGMPDWITCDNDPTNDGLYQTVFYDPSGAAEVVRTSIATTTADIPEIDVYLLVDATPTLSEEIAEFCKTEIVAIIRSTFVRTSQTRSSVSDCIESTPWLRSRPRTARRRIIISSISPTMTFSCRPPSPRSTTMCRTRRPPLPPRPRRSSRSPAASASATWFRIAAHARAPRAPTSAIHAFATAPCTWS